MTSTSASAGPATSTDRAVQAARAADLITAAAAAWLTADTVTAIGQAMAVSITEHRRVTGRHPTWADALTGIDPTLLAPMTTPPGDWPAQPAVWRRQLRLRLMIQLKHTRWVTYTPTPGSLRVADRGRDWLTATANPTTAGDTPTPPPGPALSS